ncbi:aerotolerance protein BatA [Bacteroidia bacterium]|nr:aerotolerance protein BatA [Bacteroidia bacterium]
MARPQSSLRGNEENIEGVDIMLAIDVSSSMLAEDFSPNRLEAAKKVATDFVSGRTSDRIGIVVFSGESFTQCPLTIDHNILKTQIDAIKSGMLEDGTAIGEGLATAINRLKSSSAISKTIILLTDGVNNRGSIDPISASELAKTFGIRVYTIGVGTRGMAPYPVQTPFGKQYIQEEVQIDEDMLKQAADNTGAKYFRATNKNSLQNIFQEIDKMEKSKIEVTAYERKSEEFALFLWFALGIFVVELLLRLTAFRSIP